MFLFMIIIKYGVDNFNIYLLENYNCNDINELRAKEAEYIKNQHVLIKESKGLESAQSSRSRRHRVD